MCHHLLRSVSKLAFGLMPLGLMFSVALIAGCDSAPDSSTPEAQKAIADTKANIQKTDEEANAELKKKGGKNTAVIKSMKGRMGGGPAEDAKPSQ